MPEVEEDRRAQSAARSDQLRRIMGSLTATTTIMHGAMTQVLQRGDDIEVVVQKTDELLETSRHMHYVAAPCWKRWWIDVKQLARLCRAQAHAWCCCGIG